MFYLLIYLLAIMPINLLHRFYKLHFVLQNVLNYLHDSMALARSLAWLLHKWSSQWTSKMTTTPTNRNQSVK